MKNLRGCRVLGPGPPARPPVRKRGLEPPRPCGHMDLNHARLPIPPLPRKKGRDSVCPLSCQGWGRCSRRVRLAGQLLSAVDRDGENESPASRADSVRRRPILALRGRSGPVEHRLLPHRPTPKGRWARHPCRRDRARTELRARASLVFHRRFSWDVEDRSVLKIGPVFGVQYRPVVSDARILTGFCG